MVLWWAIQEFTFAKAKVIRWASPQSASNEFEMLIRLLPRANLRFASCTQYQKQKIIPKDYFSFLVGDTGVEPVTSSTSKTRSSQLS